MIETLEASIEQTGTKGRAFEAHILGYLTADGLWAGGKSKPLRPVWAVVGGTTQQVQVFMANWLSGRKAMYAKNPYRPEDKDPIELMKSVGYKRLDQRMAGGETMTATVFLPELFGHDLGLLDREQVSFVCMPSKAWLEQKTAHLDTLQIAELAAQFLGVEIAPPDVRMAVALLAHLDRRTMAPVIQDPLFAVRVVSRLRKDSLVLAPNNALSGWSSSDEYRACERLGIRGFGFAQLGYAGCLVCHATHEQIRKVLAEEARAHLGIPAPPIRTTDPSTTTDDTRAALWHDERA